MKKLATVLVVFVFGSFAIFSDSSEAQRRPIQVGGPNGLIMGGGHGFQLGGRNGVHFGGGQGAKFGPPEFGMHFGNGQGARFGGQNFGMQFGGGQGAKFGPVHLGRRGPHPTIADRVRGHYGIDPNLTIADRVRMSNGRVPTGKVYGDYALPTASPLTATIPVVPQANGSVLSRSRRLSSNGIFSRRSDQTLARPVSRDIVVAVPRDGPAFRYELNGLPGELGPGTTLRMPANFEWKLVSIDGEKRKAFTFDKAGDYQVEKTEEGWVLKTDPKTTEPQDEPIVKDGSVVPAEFVEQLNEKASRVMNGTFDIARPPSSKKSQPLTPRIDGQGKSKVPVEKINQGASSTPKKN